MGLGSICCTANLAWETEIYSAYHYDKEVEDGKSLPKTVFHFQIPLPPEKESMLLAKCGMAPNERMGFYQTLLRCIRHEVDISDYLNHKGVGSILIFSAVEQEKEPSGISHIYLETERVWPILKKQLAVGFVPVLTVMDILYRISLIMRDISKEGIDVIHRGLDMNEVFINENNRILMGGFFYADCPNFDPPTPYLPMFHRNVPEAYLRGERGTQATDIQSVVMLAWNLFSGNPHDLRLDTSRLVDPEYAPEGLAYLLHSGFSLGEEGCNAFRRSYAQCRKDFLKSPKFQAMLPIRTQALLEYKVEYK